MNIRRITARTAIAGVTTALAAGALVGVSTTAADAATGTATYLCTNPFTTDVLPISTAVTADLSGLPPLPTGFEATEGSLPIGVSFTLSAEAVAGLKASGFHQVGVVSGDVGLPFGNVDVPLSGLAAPLADLPETGEFVISMDATNGDFRLPDPGVQPVMMPDAFDAVVSTDSVPQLPLSCTISGEAPTITQLTVIKQGSGLTAKAPKSVKQGKVLTITANVAGANVPATGKVIAKEGKKLLGTASLKKGKALIKVKNLKPGTHNIVLSYAGDKRTDPSNKAGVIVKVIKKKK